MDDDLKKNCPSCSQLYYLRLTSCKVKENLPLFLTCGHTMCESCIVTITKCMEPIECKVCLRETEIQTTDRYELIQNKSKLYQKFPVNTAMVGELAMDMMKTPVIKQKKNEEESFIVLEALLKNDPAQGNCLECEATTSKMCKQCFTNLCDTCFNRTHKSYVTFRNHVLQDIESSIEPKTCKLHFGKSLDYYCNDCKKSVCTDCMMLGGEKSCKNHDVVSLREVNETFLEELTDISPQVHETFRRLTKTAVDIGYLLYNYESDTGSVKELSKIISSVEQHFSKLFSVLQKHKNEIMNRILHLKISEKNSLQKAKSEVENSIKKAKNVLRMITAATDTNSIKQINLPALLEEAKQVTNTAWYLNRNEAIKESLKVTVNEDLCSMVNDYVHLEENVQSVYRLQATSELGDDVEVPPAPSSPVFPPAMPKDARQSKSQDEKDYKSKVPAPYKDAPIYRSKSASESSLNSLRSENSSKNNLQQQVVAQPVSPFQENEYPEQIYEGSQELIYITHVVDPNNFFVQRASSQGLVKDMIREFRNAVSFATPSLNRIAPGKTFLAFIKADKMWQRCRVLSVDTRNVNPIIQVFCFDFGSIEFVTVDRLRLLHPSKIQSPYPLAIHCSLFNCAPKAGNWTTDDSLLMQKIIDNQQAVMHVRRILSASNEDFKLDCDIYSYEHGISLVHALVFHERAKMTNPRLKYPANMGVKDNLKLYTSHYEFSSDNPELVYIIHVVSPEKIYVRKESHQDIYEKLTEDLDQEYSLAVTTGTVYLPEIGMVCAVNLEDCDPGAPNATWLRGVVVETAGRARVQVQLPDCGHVVQVHWTKLRYLHTKFTTLSALVTECHLAGITPLSNNWSTASIEYIQQYLGDLLELQVEDKRNCRQGSLGVILNKRLYNGGVFCINYNMIKEKFAASFGIHMFNKTPIEEQFLTDKSPLDKPKPVPPKPKVTILKEDMPEKRNDKDLQAKHKGPLRLEIKILNCQSPSLVYIMLIHQQDFFNYLFETMQKYYSQNNKLINKEEWKIGDRCCTLCSQSQTWRRAVIIGLEKDNANVFYSDFASTETVPKSALKELTLEFSKFRDAAILCHLSGILSAGGDEWPSITKEYLKEMINVYKRFFITKLGSIKDKSVPIQLWVYHTVHGGALEPDKSTWLCINEKILEQGLCVRDQTQAPADKTDDRDTLSFFNTAGSVSEWLQLEPMPMVPLKAIKSDDEVNANSASSIVESEDHNPLPCEGPESSNVMYVADWLPVEPLSCKEFNAMPTHIDNNGVIYLHDVSQYVTLDLIGRTLDVTFKEPDPKAKFNKWSVGEPCVALFYLDKRYYRGRVIQVNKENSTCDVHYIDYGNEENCSFADMRKPVPLLKISTQAHKCILGRIRPLGKQWDGKTLDYLHKFVVEKQCYVKVTGDPIQGVVPIELIYDKLCFNDHMVEMEMAEYKDGSKALVRKYAPIENSMEQVNRYRIVSDSGPEYKVVDEEDTTIKQLRPSQDSPNINCLKRAGVNKFIEEQQDSSSSDEFEENYITYLNDIEEEFFCTITIINDINILELSLIFHTDTTRVYEQMSEELQAESMNMSPLNGIYENKACVALFSEDNQWYRASILQFSEKKNLVKVRYVDYGNIDIISLADIREICEDWAKLPPATVSAKLFGVRLNPDVDISDITKEYSKVFLDQEPFRVKVISYDDSIPLVEIRNNKNELVYQKLIEMNILIHCK